MTVGDEYVLPTVVVEIEEADAEAQGLPVDAHAGCRCSHPEMSRRRCCGRAWSSARRNSCGQYPASRRRCSRRRRRPCPTAPPVFVEGAARRHRYLAKRAVVVVPIEQARRAVARDVDVRPAVVVEVRAGHAHSIRSRWPPAVLDKRPSSTSRADWRSRTFPKRPRMCRRRDCDTAGWCRRRIPAGRTAPESRCNGRARSDRAAARCAGS